MQKFGGHDLPEGSTVPHCEERLTDHNAGSVREVGMDPLQVA